MIFSKKSSSTILTYTGRLMTGELNYIDNQFHLAINCVEADTGKVVFSKTATAFNVERLRRAFPAMVRYLEPGYRRPNTFSDGILYLFVIGIDDYKSKSISDLGACVKDAEAVQSIIGKTGKGQYRKFFPLELYNERATRDNIVTELRLLSDMISPDDTLLLYFAGHTFSTETQSTVFITHDTEIEVKNSDIGFKNALPLEKMTTLLEEIPTNKILFIHDGNGLEHAVLERTAAAKGIVFLTACAEGEFAVEEPDHGVFTKALLKYLRAPEDLDGDEKVSVRELQYYVRRNIIDSRWSERMHPQVFGLHNDFFLFEAR